MNKDMKKRLETYVNTDKLISVYTDTSEPESFTLGYPLQLDDDNILINMISPFGEENGFASINLEDIFIFDDDRLYSGRILKLFTIKNQERKYIESLESSVINTLLKYAQNNKLLVEVNLDDNYIGFVTSFSEEILELNIIDSYAQDLGMAFIDMNNINSIGCQTKLLKDLQLLLQYT